MVFCPERCFGFYIDFPSIFSLPIKVFFNVLDVDHILKHSFSQNERLKYQAEYMESLRKLEEQWMNQQKPVSLFDIFVQSVCKFCFYTAKYMSHNDIRLSSGSSHCILCIFEILFTVSVATLTNNYIRRQTKYFFCLKVPFLSEHFSDKHLVCFINK